MFGSDERRGGARFLDGGARFGLGVRNFNSGIDERRGGLTARFGFAGFFVARLFGDGILHDSAIVFSLSSSSSLSTARRSGLYVSGARRGIGVSSFSPAAAATATLIVGGFLGVFLVVAGVFLVDGGFFGVFLVDSGGLAGVFFFVDFGVFAAESSLESVYSTSFESAARETAACFLGVRRSVTFEVSSGFDISLRRFRILCKPKNALVTFDILQKSHSSLLNAHQKQKLANLHCRRIC